MPKTAGSPSKNNGQSNPLNDPTSDIRKTIDSIRKAGKNDEIVRVAKKASQPERIPTGIFTLDFALCGGFPCGRVTELIGVKHAGKTTLCDRVIAHAHRMWPNKVAAWVDAENTKDLTWAEKQGVDLDRLVITSPPSGEVAVDQLIALINTTDISVVVLDSLAALVPIKEIDDSAGDTHVALQARLINVMTRKVQAALIDARIKKHFPAVVLVNQFRNKAGGLIFGDPRVHIGGNAVEHVASVQIELYNKEKMGKDAAGMDSVEVNAQSFKITKNKNNGGIRIGEYETRRVPNPDCGLNEGDIDDPPYILPVAKSFGWVTGAGRSWNLEIPGDSPRKYGSSVEMADALYNDRELWNKLRDCLIAENAKRLNLPDEFVEYLRNHRGLYGRN